MKLLGSSIKKEAKRTFKEKYGDIKDVNILIKEKEQLERVLSGKSLSDTLVEQEVFAMLSSKIDNLKNKVQFEDFNDSLF